MRKNRLLWIMALCGSLMVSCSDDSSINSSTDTNVDDGGKTDEPSKPGDPDVTSDPDDPDPTPEPDDLDPTPEETKKREGRSISDEQ